MTFSLAPNRRRAILFFVAAGAIGGAGGAALLFGVMGVFPALTAFALATVSAALAGLVLSGPLARAREAGRGGRAALGGVGVTVAAYALFSVAYAGLSADSVVEFSRTLNLMAEAGATLVFLLAPIGALTGWLYARAPQTKPLAPEAP